ncbi:hypothetical protein [Selenomonas sp.]|uniref:hypothetical protein n=1 Tax=Selenomonas sp. TaxID=2053611 RepID=UPI0025F34156|nr:hypothetical protein [Selenomonas sp.]MCI6084792.1 hypothetical protein [Selenomonas sp.]MCI6285161.1 hypothetical protein [Selenomonas sp.]MDY3298035.1 hypothetical protein [Selenomonas sp.]MDY4416711.1 hypothetical protein [Selenomonas sp.]
MDVTPMSMQMVVPRVSDAAQVQQNLNQAAAMQQDFEALREKEDAKLKETQVRTKDNPEDGRIKDDPNRNGQGGAYEGGSRKRGDKDGEAEDAEAFAVDPARGHHLDISL